MANPGLPPIFLKIVFLVLLIGTLELSMADAFGAFLGDLAVWDVVGIFIFP